jgi:hypothetical protein
MDGKGVWRGRAYQTAGAVDTCVARPGAVEPFWPAELPEAVFRHCDGLLVRLDGTEGNRLAGQELEASVWLPMSAQLCRELYRSR